MRYSKRAAMTATARNVDYWLAILPGELDDID
jgi:hypothetical protein